MKVPPLLWRCGNHRKQAIWQYLLTVLIAIVVVQLTGIAQASSSECCSSTAEQCGDAQPDDDGQPCQDCPPLCPGCRCTHAAFSSVLTPFALELKAPMSDAAIDSHWVTQYRLRPRYRLYFDRPDSSFGRPRLARHRPGVLTSVCSPS